MKLKIKPGTYGRFGPCTDFRPELIAEFIPGKKGGTFVLPFGGTLAVPQHTFSKNHVITCCMVAPSDRHRYLPPIQPNEKLLSEIFLLAMNPKTLRKDVTLQLPFFAQDMQFTEMELLMKDVDDTHWVAKDFTITGSGYIEFKTELQGIYVLVSCPKKEIFEVPLHGVLYNANLNHQISVRVPKKATERDMRCSIQIDPFDEENIQRLHNEYPMDMGDLITCSPVFDITANQPTNFRRSITVKLPTPFNEDEYPQDDVVIMEHTESEGWQILDVPIKFNRQSISFDTKHLGKFCIAVANPQRKKRLKEAFKRIQAEVNAVRGEILTFIKIREKQWTVLADCVPLAKVEQIKETRLGQGFELAKILEIPKEEPSEGNVRKAFRGRRPRVIQSKEFERKDLDLLNGTVYNVELKGDFVLSEDCNSANLALHFHERLPESYVKLTIAPKPEQERENHDCFGSVSFYQQDPDDYKNRVYLRKFHIEVNEDKVEEFLYVEPEPEPEELSSEEENQAEADQKLKYPSPKIKHVKTAEEKRREAEISFIRLTTPVRPQLRVVKESKVLTGRSLMSIAKEVEQGLTLAIYLDVSDSAITGMGFDALATGLSLVDITYKILMLWKRRSSRYKTQQVDILVSALEEMGRSDVAGIVLAHHKQNIEITPEAFELKPEQPSPPIDEKEEHAYRESEITIPSSTAV